MENEKGSETPETKTLLEQTQKVVDALKVENDRRESLLFKEQEWLAGKLLGGSSDAGVQPAEPKPETPKEFKEKFMRGEIPFPK